MPEYTSIATAAGDRVIPTIKQAQEAAVTAVSQVSGAVGNIIPALPSTPVTANIPNPKSFVETYFDFAEELLKTQRQYSLSLLKAVEPVTAKVLPNVKARKSVKKNAADN
jgi:hypothetical protein